MLNTRSSFISEIQMAISALFRLRAISRLMKVERHLVRNFVFLNVSNHSASKSSVTWRSARRRCLLQPPKGQMHRYQPRRPKDVQMPGGSRGEGMRHVGTVQGWRQDQ